MATFKAPGVPELSGDPKEDVKRLLIAYSKLSEQLSFVLNNLDRRNFTKTFLDEIGGGG